MDCAKIMVREAKWLPVVAASILFLYSGGGGPSRLPQAMPAVSVDGMGQATSGIPFEVLPGSGGIQPALGLSYNSGGGWGLAGKGWTLDGLPSIERDPSGLKYAASDGFISGLHGKLVLVDASNPNTPIYHSKNESFTRYQASEGCNGPCSWEVTLRDGTKYFFGENPAERLTGPDGIVIRQWALSRVADHFGNGYQVFYAERSGVLYPDEITYNNRTISFSWENRSDVRRNFSQHAEALHDRRLKRVKIKAGSFERRYTLHYSSGENGISLLAAVGQDVSSSSGSAEYQDIVFSYSVSSWDTESYSRATSLQYSVRAPLSDNLACVFYQAECFCATLNQCGCDFWGNCVFPPCCSHKLEATGNCQDYFTKNHQYSALPDTWNTVCDSGGLRHHTYLSGGDVNGDGRFDLIRLTGSESNIRLVVTFFAENGNMTDWTSPFTVPIAYNSFVGSGDFNGDGLTDFAFGRDGPLYIAYANGGGYNGPAASNVNVLATNYPRISESHAIVATSFIADMDGDGRSDFIQQTGSGFQIYLSQGNNFASPRSISVPALGGQMQSFLDFNGDGRPEYVRLHGSTLYVTEFDAALNAVVTHSAYTVNAGDGTEHRWLADVNGDGRPDWIARSGSTVSVYLFNGSGFVLSQTVSAGAGPAKTGDVNGDGLADFIYRSGSDEIILYSNGSGYDTASTRTFAGKIDIVVDTNGDGVVDFIGFGQSETVQLGHFAGIIGITPIPTLELVQQRTAIHNALIRVDGGPDFAEPTFETLIVYQPALHHSGSTGGTRNYPDLPLMAPTWLVRNIAVRQGRIKTPTGWVDDQKTTVYSYLDRRLWQGIAEARRMVGFVERRIDMPDGSRAVQRAHRSYEFAGMPAESLHYNAAGILRSRSETGYERTAPYPGTEKVQPVTHREEVYQNGVLLQTVNKSFQYDLYGNTVRETIADGGSLVTERIFSNDPGQWELGLLTDEVVSESGTIIKRKELSYQNGKITRSTAHVFPGGLTRTLSFEHDARGNVVATIGADNQRSTVGYDAEGIHAIQTENARGHTTLSSYNDRGLLRSATDANGQITEHRYDAYGRPVRTIQPAESASFTTELKYLSTEYGSCLETRKSDGSADGYFGRNCIDFAGRSYLKESKGFTNPDTGTVHTVLQVTDYDGQGRVLRSSGSYIPDLKDPVYTEYSYSIDGVVDQVTSGDGTVTTTTLNGFTTTVTSSLGKTLSTVRNSKGQVLEESGPAGTVRYGYDIYGYINRITAEDGSVSEYVHNSDGQILSQKDASSGTATFNYDGTGRLLSSTDARGITLHFEYDELGRLQRTLLPAGEGEIIQSYDTAENGRGRLAEVTDQHGTRRLSYDERGNVAAMVRTIDGIPFSFQYEYDSMNRPIRITYPDGSVVQNHYSTAGKLAGVMLDGYRVVEYFGPLPGQKLRRKTANGVETEIDYDGVHLRPTAYRTKLAAGTLSQNVELEYDASGNITKIDNLLYPARTQLFSYDAQGRVLVASGQYGQETYSYQHGNLTRMGERYIHYTDAAHPHRVMRVDAPPGSIAYTYDQVGNVIARGDIRFDYDAQSRLSRVLGPGLDERYRYGYDISGQRIKKVRVPDQTTTYYIDGVYELTRAPGQPDKHTLYIKGAQDEIVTQYTRENVTLAMLEDQAQFALLRGNLSELILSGGAFFALKMQGRIFQKQLTIFYQLHGRKLSPRMAALVLTLAALLYGFYIILRKESELRPAYAFPVPLLCLAILLTAPRCFGLDQFTGGAKDGPPPWLALAAIPQNQAAVSDNPGAQPGPGIYDPGTHGMPSVGMFYFHPDHLGSVTMITDAHGNYVSGVDIGTGASHISYKPYGEINRTNSGGPDIFRYKYTQQEEDPETGFYFYKSRYYDPYSGRFMQPDSFTFPGQTGGMNRYMYVHGNPVKFDDPTGHSPWWSGGAWWNEKDSWQIWAGLAVLDAGGIDQAMKNLSGNFNGGVNNLQGNLDDFTRGAGNFMSGLVSFMEDGGMLLTAMPGAKEQAKRFSEAWEGGFPGQNGIRYNNAIGEMALLYHASGMTPENFGKLYGIALTLKRALYNETPANTILGHNYTWDGNKDPFNAWNTHGNPNKRLAATVILTYFASSAGISGAETMAFVFMMRHLGPRPKSRLDLAAQRHDRGVPSGEWQGGGCGHIQADREFANTVMDIRILNDTIPEMAVAFIATLYYGIADQHIISNLNCKMGW